MGSCRWGCPHLEAGQLLSGQMERHLDALSSPLAPQGLYGGVEVPSAYLAGRSLWGWVKHSGKGAPSPAGPAGMQVCFSEAVAYFQ